MSKKTPHWLDDERGQELFKKMFEIADLSEVDERDLEVGTYTNQQIAEKFDDPMKLMTIPMQLPGDCPASKRSILSFAIDRE